MVYFVWLLGAFWLGAVPFGYLVGRLHGIDVRQKGSGNIGTSNVLRTVGIPSAVVVLLLDSVKAALPVWLALAAGYGRGAAIWVGMAAMFGHSFSPFMGFRGGRGVASALGVTVAATPLAALWCAIAWLIVVAATRYISLGSLIGAAAIPVVYGLSGQSPPIVAAGVVLFLLVLVRHIPNLRRLLAGTENRFGERAK